jgi:hypothetical protein
MQIDHTKELSTMASSELVNPDTALAAGSLYR